MTTAEPRARSLVGAAAPRRLGSADARHCQKPAGGACGDAAREAPRGGEQMEDNNFLARSTYMLNLHMLNHPIAGGADDRLHVGKAVNGGRVAAPVHV